MSEGLHGKKGGQGTTCGPGVLMEGKGAGHLRQEE